MRIICPIVADKKLTTYHHHHHEELELSLTVILYCKVCCFWRRHLFRVELDNYAVGLCH